MTKEDTTRTVSVFLEIPEADSDTTDWKKCSDIVIKSLFRKASELYPLDNVVVPDVRQPEPLEDLRIVYRNGVPLLHSMRVVLPTDPEKSNGKIILEGTLKFEGITRSPEDSALLPS